MAEIDVLRARVDAVEQHALQGLFSTQRQDLFVLAAVGMPASHELGIAGRGARGILTTHVPHTGTPWCAACNNYVRWVDCPEIERVREILDLIEDEMAS